MYIHFHLRTNKILVIRRLDIINHGAIGGLFADVRRIPRMPSTLASKWRERGLLLLSSNSPYSRNVAMRNGELVLASVMMERNERSGGYCLGNVPIKEVTS
ncbi:hypothetical protein Y032_0572g143 [Ancylostoma ceylanicum]|uniref:Uncharacterized protein n=1 Tax=Ancylostoma ceylanicum TaxID=53326 RepID=A0A016WQP2_9BILA|nr:hypothetical protein Y032_0572g143 [Ancylostoma ceylanicum]